jgi:hypothetical protein
LAERAPGRHSLREYSGLDAATGPNSEDPAAGVDADRRACLCECVDHAFKRR